MAATSTNDEIDFLLYQHELDATFHSRADPFPAGTPEHAELLAFVSKLYKLRKSRPDAAADGSSPADPQLAARLGLPSSYDARFRVSASVVTPPERLGAAVRAVARRMAARAAAAAVSGPSRGSAPRQGRNAAGAGGSGGGSSSCSGRWGGRDGDRGGGGAGGGGGGGVTSEMVEAAQQVVNEYRRLLPWFEDFHQRRQMARLRKLQSDRAALPAAGFRGAIVSALAASQALVVAGDTGCGKSTQIPQFLAAAGYRRIAVTQPRRISAVSLARRVAVESCDAHGTSVAYKVRFSSSAAADSRIVFCTEGILLRELVGDPKLAAYDVVVLDEVHERHLTTDFLLALLRALLLQRPELRLVLMSATINCAAFSEYFGGAPIVQIPGRLYPIQLVHVPPETESEEARRRDGDRRGGGGGGGSARGGSGRSANPAADQIDPAPYLRLLQRIDSEIPANQRGDLLVFVAGTADITALCTALAPYAEQTRRWILLPLHAALPLESQEKVFDVAPEGVRKAIISTNIAETSLTIDGVRFVADSGRAKEMIHDVASGGGSLQEGWISRASADQRKGRAGRTGPGTCYRMYSEAQFNEMRSFSAPEIARVRLEAVVLGIKAMAGSAMDPRAFGFIDPPPPDRLEASMTNLKQIGALSRSEALTSLGAVLSLLPVDVAIGKLLVLGCMFGLAGPALTLAAALSVQSPFLKLGDEEHDQEAKAARAVLVSPHGDALTLLNVFEAWLAVKQGHGHGAGGGAGGRGGGRGAPPQSGGSARWCRRHGLAEARLYEMAKLRAQFAELLADAGILRAGGSSALSAGQGAAPHHRHHRRRRREGRGGPAGGGLRGAELHAAKRRLRDMQAERERQRGRKVLKVAGGGGGGGGNRRREGEAGGGSDVSDASSSSSSGEEELERLHDLDLRVHVDVGSMASESSRPLGPGDLGLLRHLLAASLYPRLAVGDEANLQRREQDCRFHTSQVSDLVIHPGSSLFGSSNSLPRGQVLLYQELIETRRQYLSGVTPLWSLPVLLLVARRLDCDAAAARWLVDGWLLLRLHDGSGPKVLQLVMELRSGASHLVASRLRAANLAALSAVHTVDDDDDDDDDVSGGAAAAGPSATAPPEAAAASQSFQRGYAAMAAALPEELRPLLSGVTEQQMTWRREEAVRRRRLQEQQRRRLAREGAGNVAGGGVPQGNDDEEEEEDGDGGGGDGVRAAAAADAELEERLAQRLALDMWPCRYSLERLPPGNKVTAQFLIDNLQPQPQPQPQQPQAQRPDAAVPAPAPVQPEQAAGAGAAAVAAAPALPGGISGAAAAGVETDPLGVPYKCAGVWLAPWLRYGSLRSFESAMALHALQPALRKPWLCPGCGLRLVGTFSEVRDHVTSCEAVQGVDAQAVETLGYAQAASTAGGGGGGGPAGRQRGGGGGAAAAAPRNGTAEDGDDGPLSAARSAGGDGGGGAQRRLERAGEGGGGGDGGGGEEAAFIGGDAVARLERYLASPVAWCRRRPAAVLTSPPPPPPPPLATAATQHGAGYGSLGGYSGSDSGGQAVAAASGRRGAGGGGGGVPFSAPDALPQPHGFGEPLQSLGGRGSAETAGGRGGGEGSSGPTGRLWRCPVCGLEALMTPPQILQHKRQHG